MVWLAACMACMWIACVATPLLVLAATLTTGAADAIKQLSTTPAWRWSAVPGLLGMTFCWSLAITLGAAAIGIPAGIALGKSSFQARRLWSGLSIVVLCIPPYLLYWVWGLLRLPGSPLGAWAREEAWRASTLQVWQLWWGLAWWTWPLIALPVAVAVRSVPAERDDMLALDGAGPIRRTALALREVRPAILLGAGLAWISTLTGFAAFDLASTSLPMADTFGNVLRQVRFEAGANAAVLASGPLVVMTMLLVLCVAALSRAEGGAGAEAKFQADREASACPGVIDRRSRVRLRLPPGRLTVNIRALVLTGVMVISLWMPIAIMVQRVGGLEPFARLGALEGRALAESIAWAGAAGAALALLALGHAFAWSHPSRVVRFAASASACGWVVMGVMPAATRGASLITAHRFITSWAGKEIVPETLWLTLPDAVYIGWPILVIIGYLATYGMVSILLGWWIARGEDEAGRNIRVLDGAISLTSWSAARGSAVWAGVVAAGLFGVALCLGEVSTTMIVLPAGPQSLTQRLLNKMHYAYEDSALATCLLLVAIVGTLGFLASMRLSRVRPEAGARATARPVTPASASRALVLLAFAITLPWFGGCDRAPSVGEGPFQPTLIIGATGRGPGQFIYPRAAAFDDREQRLYIVDKSGRIQRFDGRGRFMDAIVLPKFDRGYPTGLSVEPGTGRLFVADTHEHRVIVYDSQGRFMLTFGSEGQGPGEMLYPTDIAFGPDGMILVSEYGGNDRIQAFDAAGRPLYSFGSFGFGNGEFNRPQAIEYDAVRNELVILDACNHRIVITDLLGKWKATVGTAGRGPGQLSYPYGLVLQADGSFIVTEFGTSRIQHLGRDGRCLGVFGDMGTGPGSLQTPWGLAAGGGNLFVVDARNDRVQALRLP